MSAITSDRYDEHTYGDRVVIHDRYNAEAWIEADASAVVEGDDAA